MTVLNFQTEAETEAKVIELTRAGRHFQTTGRTQIVVLD